MRVGLAQIDLVLADREANVTTMRQMVEQAADAGCELLVLPELWGTGYALEQAEQLSDPLGEGLFATTARLAREYQLALCGSLLERQAHGVYNTATLYTAQGELCHVYRKIHLIGLMQEDRFLQAGTAASVCTPTWGKTALAICYDLRFPELGRALALAGATMIILPAEWPLQRIEHWRVLLRARAIENQCFVLACNRVGSDHANTFGGASAVIDPWGEVLVEGDDSAALLTVELDLERVKQARAFLPVFADRRPEYYCERRGE